MIDQHSKTNGRARHPLPSPLLHDLRTPLNQIIGYSEMLSEQAKDGGQTHLIPDLEKVRAAGLRMLGLIEDNLTTSGEVSAVVEYQAADLIPMVVEDASDHEEDGLILVVDDDAGNLDVLSRRLEKQGFVCENAANGRQALNMLAVKAYDMVLLDIMMPELDGYEVLRQIKADERTKHIPVVMISAVGEMDSVARCVEMGADDYLTKPFNATLLKARIGSSLENKRGRDREVKLYQQLQQNFERLQQLERLRDDLTHMIIHDLRTPLTSMMAAVQTFDVVGEVNDGQREVIAIAVDAAGTLLGSINSLLDIEKLESGTMELDLSLLSLPELIQSAVAQVAPLADEKKLDMIQLIASELPWLKGDENKLQRTLVNLLGNAIKFTPTGGTVTLEVTAQEGAQSVRFCVRDTGEGIPPEAFERIFEKFGQVESREGGRAMSTGLGLTFCKLAVEAHGGQIGVESTRGQGSVFCFTIPVK